MSIPTRDEILFAAGGDVWTKYGTFVRRTLPGEERGSFSRTSPATFLDRGITLREAESGALRPTWIQSEGYGARLEGSRTPVNDDSVETDPSNGAWVANNGLTVSDGSATSIIGGQTADTHVGDGSTTSPHLSQAVGTFTGNDEAFSVLIEKVGTNTTNTEIRVRDTTASSVPFDANLDWSAETASSTNGTALLEKIKDSGPGGGAVFRLTALGSGTSGNNRTLQIFINGLGSGSASGSITVHHVQHEEAPEPSSPVIYTGAASTRNADDYTAQFPKSVREMTMYCKAFNRTKNTASNLGLFSIGNGDPRIEAILDGANTDYELHYRVDSFTSIIVTVDGLDLNQIVEWRGVLKSDNTVELGVSIGGGSEATATGDPGGSLPNLWSEGTLYFGQRQGGVNPGLVDLRSLRVAAGQRTMQEMRDIEL